MANLKSELLDGLESFVNARPGLRSADWDSAGFASASYQVQRDRLDALDMLRYIRWNSSIGVDVILSRARGGRLSWDSAAARWEYCAGQYEPTERRVEACTLLASVIWADRRKFAETAGESLAFLRREFGRRMVARFWE